MWLDSCDTVSLEEVIWWTDTGYRTGQVGSHTLGVPPCTSQSLHTFCSPKHTRHKLHTRSHGSTACQTAPVCRNNLAPRKRTASVPRGGQDTWCTVRSAVCRCWSIAPLGIVGSLSQCCSAVHQTELQWGWKRGLEAEWSSSLSCVLAAGPEAAPFPCWRILKATRLTKGLRGGAHWIPLLSSVEEMIISAIDMDFIYLQLATPTYTSCKFP